MIDLAKENERLRRENEHLTELLRSLTEGAWASATMWRERYLKLLKRFWAAQCDDNRLHL